MCEELPVMEAILKGETVALDSEGGRTPGVFRPLAGTFTTQPSMRSG